VVANVILFNHQCLVEHIANLSVDRQHSQFTLDNILSEITKPSELLLSFFLVLKITFNYGTELLKERTVLIIYKLLPVLRSEVMVTKAG
jgi:hypothetical protein